MLTPVAGDPVGLRNGQIGYIRRVELVMGLPAGVYVVTLTGRWWRLLSVQIRHRRTSFLWEQVVAE